MHEFTFPKQVVTLTNVNARKERHGNDEESEAVDAVDLDFSAKGALDLLPLIILETDYLKTALWDDNQNPAIKGLYEMKFNLKFEQHETVLWVGRENKSITLAPCVVKKFRLRIGAAGDPCFLLLQVQGNPAQLEIGRLCHQQQQLVELQIGPMQQSLDLEDGK